MRPGELRALDWSNLSPELLRVEQAIAGATHKETKTGRRRSVSLRDEARGPLLEWYIACGQPAPDALIIPAADGGGVWTDQGYKMWQRNVFTPAASRAGLAGLVPYDLRHTFASTLIAEGHDVIYVARQLGHSPTMTLTVYAHEFEQQRATPQPAAAQPSIADILRARS